MKTVQLGQSDLHVTPICLGTMTFGEQVDEATSHAILSRSLARGVNFLDTAEMYSVPTRAETYGATETIIGNWFAKNPGLRQKLIVATKLAGPPRGMDWIRQGRSGLSSADIVESCEGSLRRLKIDVIDLYQIHWPARHVPAFGVPYFDPAKDLPTISVHEQLETFAKLIKAGKVRAIGLSNETPYGVHEFIRLAEQHGLPRVATVQNPYCLATAALVLTTFSVFAQSGSGATMPAVDRREARQEQRIHQGEQSGALTQREAARLDRQQSRIAATEARVESDGKVTPKERARLARMQNRASRDIRHQKHDPQHR